MQNNNKKKIEGFERNASVSMQRLMMRVILGEMSRAFDFHALGGVLSGWRTALINYITAGNFISMADAPAL